MMLDLLRQLLAEHAFQTPLPGRPSIA